MVIISDADAAGLIRLARSALAELAAGEAVGPRSRGQGEMVVNVSVYAHGRLRGCMSGRGDTLEDAVRRAAARAAADVRYGPRLPPADVPGAQIEVWVQTTSEVIDIADMARQVDLGLHGVEISGDGRFAYYKPSVALTSGLTRHHQLLEKLTKKARLAPGAWRDPGTTLRRTTWEHYREVPGDTGRVQRLRRLRPSVLGELTPADLRVRAELAADRLIRVQQDDGYYLYKFHPFTRSETQGPGNLVRQAGCAYALGRAADNAAEPRRRAEIAACAGRAIDALLGRAVAEAGGVFIAEPATSATPGAPARGKLGTLALTLAALQSQSLAARYQAARQRLAEAAMSWQRPDGSFRCATDSTCAADDWASQDYFPGQALMALAAEMRAGCQHAGEAMAAALPWCQARFWTQPTTAFVPWQIEAWRLYAEWAAGVEGSVVPDASVAREFVFEMADWMLGFQIGPAASNPDLIGGYKRPGGKPGASTATYTQAVIGAFSLARQARDGDRATRYREASLRGLDFVRRLQITPDTADLFSDPDRTIGGTTATLSDMTIRCDHDQHALTAYLAALETPSLFDA